jgi:branched-subunit amino acid transport protein
MKFAALIIKNLVTPKAVVKLEILFNKLTSSLCQIHQYFTRTILIQIVFFCTAFMCLQFWFVVFWRKDFGAKAADKMLVKLASV